ncbi:MAG: B12-binding domain-containing radical SAM protein [Polyangiaceae bacterium]|nr:B12-binding domain-containing radical SAM protein [Polyangiaceae bacterium]
MRIALVAADTEENLGIGMVAASLQRAGHAVEVIAFDEAGQCEAVAARIVRSPIELVGLGLQFQHRARDFCLLAVELRRRGYSGHITAGGQHATLAWDQILHRESAIDSIVLHEGETTGVALADALAEGQRLDTVPGLALRGPEGPSWTAARPLAHDLDSLPCAHRYRPHDRHLGLPFIPMTGGRGCWGSCAFCSITTYYQQAKRRSGGRLLRLRSPANLAREMARLHHAAGVGTSLFCFHDDTLLLPRPDASLARLRDLRAELTAVGVERYGLIGKCRPDTITGALAHQLASLGVVRMFLGIENASQAGQDHLGRRTHTAELERALDSLRDAGIFTTYNLLLFEPRATLQDVRENTAFLRKFAGIPGNFCRAEPFHGTPLHQQLARRGALIGDHRGWDYRMDDDRVELLFRLTLAAFRARNYDCAGVGNRYVGLAYAAQLVRVFFPEDSPRRRRALADADALVARISIDSADFLDRAIDLVETVDVRDVDRMEREAVDLALRVGARDRAFQLELDRVNDELRAVAAGSGVEHRAPRPARRQKLAERAVLAASVLASAAACGGDADDRHPPQTGGSTMMGDGGSPPVIGGSGGTSSTPSGGASGTGGSYIQGDGGFPPVIGGSGGTSGSGGNADGGFPPVVGGSGATSGTGGNADGGFPPVVGGSGRTPSGGTSGTGGLIAGDGGFPPAIGGGPMSGGGPSGTGGTAEGNAGASHAVAGAAGATDEPAAGAVAALQTDRSGHNGDPDLTCSNDAEMSCVAQVAEPPAAELVDHWRDTSPSELVRSRDLPLYDPPDLTLEARQAGDAVHVIVRGATADTQLYWDGPGLRDVRGHELYWYPTSSRDRLTLVARRSGGVMSTSVSAGSVSRS